MKTKGEILATIKVYKQCILNLENELAITCESASTQEYSLNDGKTIVSKKYSTPSQIIDYIDKVKALLFDENKLLESCKQ